MSSSHALPVPTAVNREYAAAATVLESGDELALIPPVSGGEEAAIHVAVSSEPLSAERLTALVGDPRAGAVVVFQGMTREIAALDYEAYAEMASEQMEAILRESVRRHGLRAAAAEHRVGRVALGEPSVIVAVSSPHREEAFAGASAAIDAIKAQAPIWKREEGGGRVQGDRAASSSGARVTGRLTHLDEDGRARMVDVSEKPATTRIARARARRAHVAAAPQGRFATGRAPRGRCSPSRGSPGSRRRSRPRP